MKPSVLIETIKSLYEYSLATGDHVVPFISGPPGIGKSACVHAAAAPDPVIDLRLVLLDPTDLRGLPHVDREKNIARWSRPSFIPEADARGFIFYDEINAAPPVMQAAAYQPIWDRCIGDHPIPKNIFQIAAGNGDKDRAVVNRLSTAMGSRLIHLDLEVDVQDWKQWAYKHDIRTEVIGFINAASSMLHKFNVDPNSKDGKSAFVDRTFPCPRTWEFVSKLLKANLPGEALTEAVKGAVGEGAGLKFMSFMRFAAKAPDPEKIIKDPSSHPIPKEADVRYLTVSSLAARFDLKNASAILTYFDRWKDDAREFPFIAVRDALLRLGPAFSNECESLRRWVLRPDNAKVISG